MIIIMIIIYMDPSKAGNDEKLWVRPSVYTAPKFAL